MSTAEDSELCHKKIVSLFPGEIQFINSTNYLAVRRTTRRNGTLFLRLSNYSRDFSPLESRDTPRYITSAVLALSEENNLENC